jgi:lipopolysaccharide/colanic/teichoic acid biosynthesis glycosyltransferase
MRLTSASTVQHLNLTAPDHAPPASQEGVREEVLLKDVGSPGRNGTGADGAEVGGNGLATAQAGVTDWVGLEPRGVYGNVGRPLLDLALTLICAPLVGLLALPLSLVNWTVYRSRKKILFRQERVGQRGEMFIVYKFRTMRDADGEEFESWKEGDRDRVTRFGRFMRKTHLDELPQIVNILRGEMTFIGPRPEMVGTHEFACRAVSGFERRLVLRPGITGRAQIRNGYAGHDVKMYRQKFEEDELYLKHYSLLSDLAILVKTPVWMLGMRGWRDEGRPAQRAEARHVAPVMPEPDGDGAVVLESGAGASKAPDQQSVSRWVAL